MACSYAFVYFSITDDVVLVEVIVRILCTCTVFVELIIDNGMVDREHTLGIRENKFIHKDIIPNNNGKNMNEFV